jgi:alpha-N-arabinofuranosidase
MDATIQIKYDCKTGEISPLLYGAGFEHIGGAINLGLDAQMLDGRSFEEEDVNSDGVSDKWLPSGWGTNTVRYRMDGEDAFHARYSQKIEMLHFRNGERGVKQGGLYIEKGKRYITALYLRKNEGEKRSSVCVRLGRGDDVYAEETIDTVSSKWSKYTLPLVPLDSSSDAEFIISLKGTGTLWVDQVSLLPDETYLGHGTRKNIMEKIILLGPTCIRWPGGWFSENYHWKDGVGAADRRPIRKKYHSSVRIKNDPSWESNSFGTDEFIQLCSDVNAIPILTLNIGYKEGEKLEDCLKEADEWVEYCNGLETTSMGVLRAAHGYPESYGVQYWGVGNEPWQMDPEDYGKRFIEFATTLKPKYPHIKLIAAGGNGYDIHWNRKIIEVAGKHLDNLDLHYYYSNADYLEAMAEPLKYELYLKEIEEIISSLSPQRAIKLSIMEWNSNTNWKDANQLRDGLFAASFINALERRGDLVEHAIPWPLLRRVQPPGNHISDHGLIWYDNHRVYLSATALAFQLYRQNYAPERILTDVKSNAFTTPKGVKVPCLDAIATRDSEKKSIVLKVVNKDPTSTVKARIDVEGVSSEKIGTEARVSTLTGPNIHAKNSLEHPEEVLIVDSVFKGASGSCFYMFPPHSATVIRFEMR